MKNILVLFDLCFLFFVGANLHTSEKSTRILFIGNSYTYRNEMPDIFEQIALSQKKKVYVSSVTKGKATLQIQSQREEVFEAIREKKWDYVIVQGSSRDMLADPITLQNETFPALEKIVKAIRKNRRKTKILFYMTWGYKNGFKPLDASDTYEKMSITVRDGYLYLKKKYKFGVVPVGMAWLESRRLNPNVNLYVKDGAHPSYKGSYLAACCFYSAIFNESAVGVTYYGVLGPKICNYLQTTASRIVLSQRHKYGLNRYNQFK